MARKGELYLIDSTGFEYSFNADMARHADLYAVMRDGEVVPWQAAPDVKGGGDSGVLSGDRMPTQQELLAAAEAQNLKTSFRRQSEVAMKARAAQARREAEAGPTLRLTDSPLTDSDVSSSDMEGNGPLTSPTSPTMTSGDAGSPSPSPTFEPPEAVQGRTEPPDAPVATRPAASAASVPSPPRPIPPAPKRA